MGQSKFLYPEMAIAPHGKLSDYLHEKYGDNVVWPLIWFDSQNQNVKAVTFEINSKNKVNKHIDARHKILDSVSIPAYKTEYSESGNKYELLKGIVDTSYNFIEDSIKPKFNNSHEYIQSNNRNLRTVDIDYLWIKDGEIRGLEVSTFFVSMDTREIAEGLVQKFVDNRCKDNFKIRQFELLSKCSDIFKDSKIRMVFLNNKKGTTEIIEGSNVIWFSLDEEQVKRMSRGELPKNMKFTTLEKFLGKL